MRVDCEMGGGEVDRCGVLTITLLINELQRRNGTVIWIILKTFQ